MLERIMIPLDRSSPSEHAIPSVETLARVLRAEVVLFQPYNPLKLIAGEEFYKFPADVLHQEDERLGQFL